MASILLAAGALSYDQIKKTRAKRAEKKVSDQTHFSELERSNAARIAQLQGQGQPCSCQAPDWRGGCCHVHGYVPATGAPAPEYSEVDSAGGAGRHEAPACGDGAAGDGGVVVDERDGDRCRKGKGDGVVAERRKSMRDEEVRRINEERRKRMKAGGFTNWVLRRKGNGGGGDAALGR